MNAKPLFVAFLVLYATAATLTPKVRADDEVDNVDIKGGFWWYIHIGRHGNKCHNHNRWGQQVCWDKGWNLTCCKHRCCDLDWEDDNCGACGVVCPYPKKCCKGKCISVMSDPYNCGQCGKKCPHHRRCNGGMCGYAA
ncbi:hypothetical protein MLD38_036832 [Melastoma candidum]|uniref:Uncharacterized protein n=1 Tax=Melastoma candidum TaxID=119954 RepID=A0ACB9LKR7_9MYRT|nr:hypothetical protein MLD38_036832 [Melastoma candidum]